MTNPVRSKRRGLVAALMLPVFFLAGCVKMDMGIELHEDNTADVQMTIIDKSGMLFDPAMGGGSCDDLASEMNTGDGAEDVEVVVEEIEEDGNKGCKISAEGGDISEGLAQGITGEDGGIERDGDVFNISLPAITGEEAPSEIPGMEFSFAVTFPGEVIDTNGTISKDGRTVTWSQEQANQRMEASGNAVPGSNLGNLIVLIAGAVLLIAAVGAGLYFVKKNKEDKDNEDNPPGTLPEWDGSSTVPAPSYAEDEAPQQGGYPAPQQSGYAAPAAPPVAPQNGYPAAPVPPAGNGGYPAPPANGGGLPPRPGENFWGSEGGTLPPPPGR